MNNQPPKSSAKQLTRWLPTKIQENPPKSRNTFDESLSIELLQKMTTVGLLTDVIIPSDMPICMHDPEYLLLIDGARRLRAARRMTEPKTVKLLLTRLCKRRFRMPMSLAERAVVYARLISDLKLS